MPTLEYRQSREEYNMNCHLAQCEDCSRRDVEFGIELNRMGWDELAGVDFGGVPFSPKSLRSNSLKNPKTKLENIQNWLICQRLFLVSIGG